TSTSDLPTRSLAAANPARSGTVSRSQTMTLGFIYNTPVGRLRNLASGFLLGGRHHRESNSATPKADATPVNRHWEHVFRFLPLTICDWRHHSISVPARRHRHALKTSLYRAAATA